MKRLRMSVFALALLASGLFSLASAIGSGTTDNDSTPTASKCSLPPVGSVHVSVDVLVDGKPVGLISHGGRLYLAVPRMGAEYAIRVNNRSARRITAVVSVDGLSVITKEPASDLQPGYVVDPYAETVIKGWRHDLDTVAAFTFEERENGFAYRLGQRDNIGVIGLVAIEEYEPDPRPVLRKETPVAAQGGEGVLGTASTGSGRNVDSGVIAMPFVRGTNKRTVTIYYETPAALRSIGVPVEKTYLNPVAAASTLIR
jgi:hypothetical protein